MHRRRFLFLPVLLLLVPVVAGCGRKMMPTPAVFWSGEIDLWDEVADDDRSPWVTIFYATDRPAAGAADDRKYKNGRGKEVRLGEVEVRLGTPSMTWDELVEASMEKHRHQSVPLVQGDAEELGVLSDPAGRQAFADAINTRLATSDRRNINIYVHGANVGFYDSVVVAAQFYHFQVRDSVMLAFSWPTRQSPAFYGFDKAEAKKSIPNLVELLDFLANDTDVDAINILGYSAGGPLVAGALADLRERYPDLDEPGLRAKLKISNVYFAASDAGLRDFIQNDLKTFHPLPETILVTISRDDPILGLAGVLGGGARVGGAKADNLTREELEELDRLMPKIDVIDVSYYDKGREGGSFSGHGYWYTNPWVATDVLAAFRWSIPPDVRGLVRVTDDSQTWYFPNDYPERITDTVLRVRAGNIEPGR